MNPATEPEPPAAAPTPAPHLTHEKKLPQVRLRPALCVIAIALLAAIVWGIHSRDREEAALEQETRAMVVPFIHVTHPTAGSGAGEIALPGNTQAWQDTGIFARTTGYLKRWNVDIGAQVQQGQLLAEIETPELDQQLQQAQADLRNAQANLEIDQVTAKRLQTLLPDHYVTQQQVDEAVSTQNSQQAVVDENTANVHRLQQLQAFEKIYAPFDGVITARNTNIGALIQNGSSATGQKELFHINDTRKLRVFVPVPEANAGSVHPGDLATLTLDAFPGQVFNGTVARTSNAIDPVSRTLNVEVDVDNPTGQLLPGAYAFVHLNLPPTPGAVTIPANTLLFRAEGLRVGVVRNGRVTLVPITIGHDYGSTVEVTSGLTPGDTIVLDPSDSLADGAAVQVEASKSPRPAS